MNEGLVTGTTIIGEEFFSIARGIDWRDGQQEGEAGEDVFHAGAKVGNISECASVQLESWRFCQFVLTFARPHHEIL